ncbi:MAG: hypothetical protein MHM6MM_002299 [Cercozoa sp. M6MM]
MWADLASQAARRAGGDAENNEDAGMIDAPAISEGDGATVDTDQDGDGDLLHRAYTVMVTREPSKKEFVLQEIVNTERAYVDALSRIASHYRAELVEWLGNDAVVLFSNAPQLHSLSLILLLPLAPDCRHTQLLHAMESEGAVPALEKHLQFFRLYYDYVNNYEDMVSALRNLRDGKNSKGHPTAESKQVQEALMRLDSEPSVVSNLSASLESLLIMPVQRLPRYALLLRELQRHSGEEEREYYTKVLNAMTERVEAVNECKRRSDAARSSAIPELPPLSGTWGVPIFDNGFVQPHRHLVVKSEAREWKMASGHIKSRKVYLFTDVLLVTTDHDHFKRAVPLRTCRIRRFAEIGHRLPLSAAPSDANETCLVFLYGDAVLLLLLRDMEQMEEWLEIARTRAEHERQRYADTRRGLDTELAGRGVVVRDFGALAWLRKPRLPTVSEAEARRCRGYGNIFQHGQKVRLLCQGTGRKAAFRVHACERDQHVTLLPHDETSPTWLREVYTFRVEALSPGQQPIFAFHCEKGYWAGESFEPRISGNSQFFVSILKPETLVLMSHRGEFLAAANDGSVRLVQPSSSNELPPDAVFALHEIKGTDGAVALQSRHGKFLCADKKKTTLGMAKNYLSCNRLHCRDWEFFQVAFLGAMRDVISIRSRCGYLADHRGALVVDKPHRKSFERWMFLPVETDAPNADDSLPQHLFTRGVAFLPSHIK